VDERSLAPPRLWTVFAAYLVAFVAIVALSLVAAGVLRSMYPDVPDPALFDGLPGLIAGGLASSMALLFTVALFNRPLEPVLLRLVPGWETGRALAVMVVGMLALGQAAATVIRDAFAQGWQVTASSCLECTRECRAAAGLAADAVGPELFLAVFVIGVLAGSAEELFFRGYMQTRLGQRMPPVAAVLITATGFGLLHLEWIHALLAFVLGLYLGWITEVAGSALPAIACHVINNALFTMLAALVGTVGGAGPNAALLVTSGCVFVGSVVWLRRCRTW